MTQMRDGIQIIRIIRQRSNDGGQWSFEEDDLSSPILDYKYTSNNINPKYKLYSAIKEITGERPEDNFDLTELIGLKAKIAVKHKVDSQENAWENVVSVTNCLTSTN